MDDPGRTRRLEPKQSDTYRSQSPTYLGDTGHRGLLLADQGTAGPCAGRRRHGGQVHLPQSSRWALSAAMTNWLDRPQHVGLRVFDKVPRIAAFHSATASVTLFRDPRGRLSGFPETSGANPIAPVMFTARRWSVDHRQPISRLVVIRATVGWNADEMVERRSSPPFSHSLLPPQASLKVLHLPAEAPSNIVAPSGVVGLPA